MNFKTAKIEAQNALLFSKARAYFILLFCFFGEVFFLLSGLFCIFMAVKFRSLLPENISPYLAIGIFVLFLLGALCSLWFLSLFPFLRTRWFSENAKHKAPLSAFFRRLSMREIFKISYLFFYVRVMSLLHLVLFLLPVTLCGFLFYKTLTASGFSKLSFWLCLGFLVVLFLLSLYFCLAALQKYSLLSVLLCENPKRPLLELLALSRRSTEGLAFSLLRQKLSFLPWFLLSLLLLPAPYAFSYYFETQTVLSRRILKSQKLLRLPQKPVVFLRLQHA